MQGVERLLLLLSLLLSQPPLTMLLLLLLLLLHRIINALNRCIHRLTSHSLLSLYVCSFVQIPNLATAVLDGNANATEGNVHINLVSIAIGNGWVDPLSQTETLGAQAYQLGLIDENDLTAAETAVANCTQLVQSEEWAAAQQVCDAVQNNIIQLAGNINVDDVRDLYPDDEVDDRLEVYLSSADVQAAIGLTTPLQGLYTSCSAAVGAALATDEMIPSVHLLPRLINELKMVYLYEGIFDFNCGVTGVEHYLSKLLPTAYAKAKKSVWRSSGEDNTLYGYVRPILATLTFIIIQDAGHM